MKSFFNYQPGSYWIFKDSVSGSFDSLSVRKRYHIVDYESRTDSFELEEICFTEYKGMAYPWDHDYWVLDIRYQDGIYYTELGESKPCPDFTYNWPFDLNHKPDSVQKAYYPEFTVNGKNYKGVYFYRRDYNGNQFFEYYFNADSGFIQFSSYDWLGNFKLERSHIIR